MSHIELAYKILKKQAYSPQEISYILNVAKASRNWTLISKLANKMQNC